MNNFELIKKMNIDEMADFFAERIQCRSCFLPSCPTNKDCEDIFKDWLERDVFPRCKGD